MYSIVMVAAMTASPEVPDFFFKNKGCHGCYGCCGGGCCGGYSYGCCGGGCCGGCWGCHGYTSVGSCYGCGGCHGCYGGYALTGCCGGGYAVPTAPGVYIAPGAPVVPAPPPPPVKDGIKKTSTDGPMAIGSLPVNRGQVVVYVPADAKLYAEGQATTLGGTERVFQTPDLVEGRDFQYTLKVEFAQGGETKSTTKQVLVRAGHRTVVDFTNTNNDSVSSSVTVNLPAKAKLFVDGVATPISSGTHTFRTPELTKGKSYVYAFRAEIDREGKTEIENREVTFKGGDPIIVDFADTAVRTASVK